MSEVEPFVGGTERLFLFLLRLHRTDVVCDVGSFDATHARRFRRVRPAARVLAFEADPRNSAAIAEHGGLDDLGIELQAVAVGDRDGITNIHAVEGPANDPRPWGSLTSTRSRAEIDGLPRLDLPTRSEDVPMVRLDTVLSAVSGRIALWIDVEGGAFEVLRGAVELLERTTVVQVEVETGEIWTGQKTEPHVRALLVDRGFVLIARGTSDLQRDLLFVRRHGPRGRWLATVCGVVALRALAPLWRALRRVGTDRSVPA